MPLKTSTRLTVHRTRLLCLGLGLLLHTACEFELKDFYEPERNEDHTAPEIIVNELSFVDDTIYLYWDKTLSFDFASTNQEIVSTTVYLDNEEVLAVNSGKGSIGFRPEELSTRSYNLSIEVMTRTGSGSIAEQLDGEYYIFNEEYILIVVKDLDRHFNLEYVDGLLRVSWPACLDKEYEEFRFFWEGVSPQSWNTLCYTDSGYIGQPRQYGVKVRTRDGKEHWWTGSQNDYNFPEIDVRTSDSGTHYLVWNKFKYFNAIDSIIVTQYHDSYKDPYFPKRTLRIVKDLDDTICHIPDFKSKELQFFGFLVRGKYIARPFENSVPVLDYRYLYVPRDTIP